MPLDFAVKLVLKETALIHLHEWEHSCTAPILAKASNKVEQKASRARMLSSVKLALDSRFAIRSPKSVTVACTVSIFHGGRVVSFGFFFFRQPCSGRHRACRRYCSLYLRVKSDLG